MRSVLLLVFLLWLSRRRLRAVRVSCHIVVRHGLLSSKVYSRSWYSAQIGSLRNNVQVWSGSLWVVKVVDMHQVPQSIFSSKICSKYLSLYPKVVYHTFRTVLRICGFSERNMLSLLMCEWIDCYVCMIVAARKTISNQPVTHPPQHLKATSL